MVLTDLLDGLVTTVLVLLLGIGVLFARRVVIRRRGGTFDCSLRLTPGSAQAAVHFGASHQTAVAQRGTSTPLSAAGVRAGRGWSYGVAQYENDRIDWFRIFSYAFRPAAVLTRPNLEVIGRRDAEGHEELALFPGWTIVECGFGAGLVELAMSPDALTGFLSWIEGAPPGQNVSRVS